MKRIANITIIFVVLATSLFASCAPPPAPNAGSCNNGVCVDLSLVEPIQLNQPVPVSISVQTEQSQSQMPVQLASWVRSDEVGQTDWTIDTQANIPVLLSTTLIFREEGDHFLFVSVLPNNVKVTVDDHLVVRITGQGGTINPPTATSGEPVLQKNLSSLKTETPQPHQVQRFADVNLPIPDDQSWLSYPVEVDDEISQGIAVSRAVGLKVVVGHPRPEDLVVELLGPDNATTATVWNRQAAGPEHQLDPQQLDGQWLFMLDTTAFIGQPVNGAWTIRIRDEVSGETGTLINYSLVIGFEKMALRSPGLGTHQSLRPTAKATATATPASDPLADYIAWLKEELKDPQLNPARRKEIEESLQLFAQPDVYRETATFETNNQVATFEAINKGTAGPSQSFKITGIRNTHFVIPNADIINENAWLDLVDAEYVMVYAGYNRKDPSMGEICFQTEITPLTCVYTQDKPGSIRIVEHKEKEGKLILESKDGKRYFFDLRGRKFATSIDEVIPTITPHNPENNTKTPTG